MTLCAVSKSQIMFAVKGLTPLVTVSTLFFHSRPHNTNAILMSWCWWCRNSLHTDWYKLVACLPWCCEADGELSKLKELNEAPPSQIMTNQFFVPFEKLKMILRALNAHFYVGAVCVHVLFRNLLHSQTLLLLICERKQSGAISVISNRWFFIISSSYWAILNAKLSKKKYDKARKAASFVCVWWRSVENLIFLLTTLFKLCECLLGLLFIPKLCR